MASEPRLSPSNPIQIHQFLAGLDFPATRAQLIDRAERNDADEEVLLALRALPDRTFDAPADLTDAVGRDIPPAAKRGGTPS